MDLDVPAPGFHNSPARMEGSRAVAGRGESVDPSFSASVARFRQIRNIFGRWREGIEVVGGGGDCLKEGSSRKSTTDFNVSRILVAAQTQSLRNDDSAGKTVVVDLLLRRLDVKSRCEEEAPSDGTTLRTLSVWEILPAMWVVRTRGIVLG